MFSRRHYQAIAKLLRDAAWDAEMETCQHTVDKIRNQFVAMFHADNPRFSRARFIEASSREPDTATEREIRQEVTNG